MLSPSTFYGRKETRYIQASAASQRCTYTGTNFVDYTSECSGLELGVNFHAKQNSLFNKAMIKKQKKEKNPIIFKE